MDQRLKVEDFGLKAQSAQQQRADCRANLQSQHHPAGLANAETIEQGNGQQAENPGAEDPLPV
jgi:hypothetical protein